MDISSSTLNESQTGANMEKASHHDTHALPPQFIQDAYKHYNTVKRAELDADRDVIDFDKGLSGPQQLVMKSVGCISASAIRDACERYENANLASNVQASVEKIEYKDVTVYEHQEFPGLQVAPRLLPDATQFTFLSQILHDCLANPQHKTNLQVDYDLDYPAPKTGDTQQSLFQYKPADVHALPKDGQQQALNMQQYLSRKLRWLTIGAQYDWPTRSYSGQNPTEFPPALADLVSGFFPHIKSESGVCLLYGGKDYMPVHRDVSEQCERALASFSFGCDGIFLVARGEEDTDDPEEKRARVVAIRVHSGDCVHLSGESRWAWHAMARTISNTCPKHLASWPARSGDAVDTDPAYEKWKGFMGSKRLNVSCRQVWN